MCANVLFNPLRVLNFSGVLYLKGEAENPAGFYEMNEKNLSF